VTGRDSQAAIALSLAAGLRHMWMISPTRLGACAGQSQKVLALLCQKAQHETCRSRAESTRRSTPIVADAIGRAQAGR
jgi:hypothetical protein